MLAGEAESFCCNAVNMRSFEAWPLPQVTDKIIASQVALQSIFPNNLKII